MPLLRRGSRTFTASVSRRRRPGAYAERTRVELEALALRGFIIGLPAAIAALTEPMAVGLITRSAAG